MKTPVLNHRFERYWGKTCLFGEVTDCEDMNAQLFFSARIYAQETRKYYLSFDRKLWDWNDEATEKLHYLFQEAFLSIARLYKPDVIASDLNYEDTSYVLVPPPGRGPLYPHIHLGVNFTLVYYINTSPNQGLLRLWNPKLVRRENIEIQPYQGLLVILPGEFPHDVKAFHATEDRLCVVSNCKIQGIKVARNAKLAFYWPSEKT
ncbi:MAG: hypothetical protein P4M08_10280 [Oligoflexia bacterium]|nr:hypothetical protein [Oligoflexia bacterium]